MAKESLKRNVVPEPAGLRSKANTSCCRERRGGEGFGLPDLTATAHVCAVGFKAGARTVLASSVSENWPGWALMGESFPTMVCSDRILSYLNHTMIVPKGGEKRVWAKMLTCRKRARLSGSGLPTL